jgi:2-C-methyl-D-erythritol 4-phosphate cytidylyltransferase
MKVAGVVFATDLAHDVPGAAGLLGGRPLLAWAVSALAGAGGLGQLLVVAGAAAGQVSRALDGQLPGHRLVVIGGDRTRHGSIHCVLSILDSDIDLVLLHDALRPLAPPEVVSRVVGAVRSGALAAVPVVEVTETVKELDPAGRIARTVPRESMVRLQTPQAVRRSLLAAAHSRCGRTDLVTDGAGALVPAGTQVVTVEGDHAAFPVLHPADLALAEAVLASRG